MTSQEGCYRVQYIFVFPHHFPENRGFLLDDHRRIRSRRLLLIILIFFDFFLRPPIRTRQYYYLSGLPVQIMIYSKVLIRRCA